MPVFVLITPTAPTVPANYVLAAGEPTCNGLKTNICYILAEKDEDELPVIGIDLITEMLTAVISQSDTKNVKLRS